MSLFDPFLMLFLLVALADGQLSPTEAEAIAATSAEVTSVAEVHERARRLQSETARREGALAIRDAVTGIEATELVALLRGAYVVADVEGSAPAEVAVVDGALRGRIPSQVDRDALHAWARRAAVLEAEGMALVRRAPTRR